MPAFTPHHAPKQERGRTTRGRCVCLALVFGGVVLVVSFHPWSDLAAFAARTTVSPWGIGMVLVLYVALLALPFVPGAEIGFALIFVLGARMALPVYVATIVALSIAFLVGRLASQRWPTSNHGGAARASDPLAGLMAARRPFRLLQPLMRFRWLAVIVLINTPGNTAIGGGGGIAMAVGYSRTFTYPAFLACVALAVAPLPVAVLIAESLGFDIGLDRWAQGLAGALPARGTP